MKFISEKDKWYWVFLYFNNFESRMKLIRKDFFVMYKVCQYVNYRLLYIMFICLRVDILCYNIKV